MPDKKSEDSVLYREYQHKCLFPGGTLLLFYHNLYLVDETILNENLCRWLQEELELPKLAAKLRPLFERNYSIEEFLYPVFKEINYLTYEEMKSLNMQIQKLAEEAPFLREKRKGDALVENGMYVHAIQVYQKLLEEETLEEVREGFTEDIFHNLGCAYSYLSRWKSGRMFPQGV